MIVMTCQFSTKAVVLVYFGLSGLMNNDQYFMDVIRTMVKSETELTSIIPNLLQLIVMRVILLQKQYNNKILCLAWPNE